MFVLSHNILWNNVAYDRTLDTIILKQIRKIMFVCTLFGVTSKNNIYSENYRHIWRDSECRFCKIFRKLGAHGTHCSPEKIVQINKHIWLYHKVDEEKKKHY